MGSKRNLPPCRGLTCKNRFLPGPTPPRPSHVGHLSEHIMPEPEVPVPNPRSGLSRNARVFVLLRAQYPLFSTFLTKADSTQLRVP